MGHHTDPLSDLFRLQDRMNRVFDELTNCRPRDPDARIELKRPDWVPAADFVEHEKEYVLAVDLPGIERSKLGIEIEKDRLVVHGERPSDTKSARRDERPAGRFLRRFEVPTNVDHSSVEAEYKDGVLRVHLPKRSEDQPERVRIQVQ